MFWIVNVGGFVMMVFYCNTVCTIAA